MIPRPVFVGIAPSCPEESGQPLSAIAPNATGRRLAVLADMSPLRFMMATDRVNLCPHGREGSITVAEGRPFAEMLAGSLLRHRTVVMLGRNVADCFGVRESDPCVWYSRPLRPETGTAGYRAGKGVPPFRWGVLPHPSGRNRWYNDLYNLALAEKFVRDLMKEFRHDEG